MLPIDAFALSLSGSFSNAIAASCFHTRHAVLDRMAEDFREAEAVEGEAVGGRSERGRDGRKLI